MADVFSKSKRSEIMSRIKSKNTKVEILVFKELRRRGVYFQSHYKRALGNPDIALPRKKIAIFIDGDFWHGFNFAKNKNRLPKKYWRKKIENNILRDHRTTAKLKKEGWKVLRLWESQINKKTSKSIDKINKFLRN